jgi:predicted HAD superfamily Cof-like phosphohydrolase
MKIKKFITVGLLASVSSLSQAIGVAGHASSHSASHVAAHSAAHSAIHSSHHVTHESSSPVTSHLAENKTSTDIAFLAAQMANNVSKANGYSPSDEQSSQIVMPPSSEINDLNYLMYGSIAMILGGFGGLAYLFSNLSKENEKKISPQDRINDIRSKYDSCSSKPNLKI